MFDFLVIGGGIVGLATTWKLTEQFPDARIALVEKERGWAAHQSSHNSGVIHSGVYYRPGSLKARLARDGNAAMVAFCRQWGIRHDLCGKLIVAGDDLELERLEELERRAEAHGIPVERLDGAGVRAREPYVRAIAALHVPSAGMVSYPEVCRELARLIEEAGVETRLAQNVVKIEETAEGYRVSLAGGESERTLPTTIESKFLIACAGLQSDRLARLEGLEPPLRIIPFRGVYYDFSPSARGLVRSMVYSVPDPALPFLGVHLLRRLDGRVEAGPNAVLALAREGYGRADVSAKDVSEIFSYPGFWKMASRNIRTGFTEMARTASRSLYARSVQRFLPELKSHDLSLSRTGVRAQAVGLDGTLLDDFYFLRGRRSLHVLNAPSPAATASLEIGKEILLEVKQIVEK